MADSKSGERPTVVREALNSRARLSMVRTRFWGNWASGSFDDVAAQSASTFCEQCEANPSLVTLGIAHHFQT